MEIVKVTTQQELDSALASPAPREVWICGTGRFVLRESAQHHVSARESAHVVARESYHGVDVADGIATVFKAVRHDYRSAHGLAYVPGTTPIAPDWDGGKEECGGGLHFSPSAAGAKGFDDEATRFLSCQVRLSDMRAPKADDSYPSKIKASGCCAPVSEVTLWGAPVAAATGVL